MEKTAIQELRMLRNIHLSCTDWWGCSDQTMTAEQSAYRQALRDVPNNYTPAFDENEDITDVTWPTKPE